MPKMVPGDDKETYRKVASCPGKIQTASEAKKNKKNKKKLQFQLQIFCKFIIV